MVDAVTTPVRAAVIRRSPLPVRVPFPPWAPTVSQLRHGSPIPCDAAVPSKSLAVGLRPDDRTDRPRCATASAAARCRNAGPDHAMAVGPDGPEPVRVAGWPRAGASARPLGGGQAVEPESRPSSGRTPRPLPDSRTRGRADPRRSAGQNACLSQPPRLSRRPLGRARMARGADPMVADSGVISAAARPYPPARPRDAGRRAPAALTEPPGRCPQGASSAAYPITK